MPLVSIIIPAYNSARYLPQTLISVLNQTINDYEIIVVNDGSTDDTEAILAGYAKHIKVIYQGNAGVSAARNKGLEAAHGTYILFLDADDTISADKLEKQLAVFQSDPTLGLVHSGWWLTDEDGKILEMVTPWHNAPILDLETWLRWKPVLPSAMLIKREWILRVNGFEDGLAHAEDVDLVLRMTLEGCKSQWLKTPTVYYRQHGENASHQRQKQIDGIIHVLNKFFDLPNVPKRIPENEIRYYTMMWYIQQLCTTQNLDLLPHYLRLVYSYTRYSPLTCLLDWLMRFKQCSPGTSILIDVLGEDLRPVADWWQDTWMDGQKSNIPTQEQINWACRAVLFDYDLQDLTQIDQLQHHIPASQWIGVVYLAAFLRAFKKQRFTLAMKALIHAWNPLAWGRFLKITLKTRAERRL